MLQRAAAARGRVRAWRRDPVDACGEQCLHIGGEAVASFVRDPRAYALAGQHATQEQRDSIIQLGDPVAIGADTRDAGFAAERRGSRRQAPNADSPVCARPRISA
jgi:hypothetical protein